MAITNRERVGGAMDALKGGLAPFVSREFINHHKGRSDQELQQVLGEPVQDAKGHFSNMDASALLRVMWESWNEVYRDTLGRAERSLVSELRDIRNRWAHQEAFSSDDAYRALDSTHRLLTAVSSPGGRRGREHEDGTAARALRRAGTHTEAQDRGNSN